MYKFLTMFAELLSEFALRVQGLARNAEDNDGGLDADDVVNIVNDKFDVLDEDDVVRIVNDNIACHGIELGSIDADDVIGLARFVDESIAEFDFDDLIQKHVKREKLMSLLLMEGYRRGINTKYVNDIYEVNQFDRYLEERFKDWQLRADNKI